MVVAVAVAWLAMKLHGVVLLLVPQCHFWLAYPVDHPFNSKDEITLADIEGSDLLLLSEGHCLADQVMEVCHLKKRKEQGEMADLRASSLETLLQLVGAGFGTTLVPALAVRNSWGADSGIVVRQLDLPNAFRRVSLVYRRSYPRQQALQAFADVIHSQLPNTVQLIK